MEKEKHAYKCCFRSLSPPLLSMLEHKSTLFYKVQLCGSYTQFIEMSSILLKQFSTFHHCRMPFLYEMHMLISAHGVNLAPSQLGTQATVCGMRIQLDQQVSKRADAFVGDHISIYRYVAMLVSQIIIQVYIEVAI